MTIGGVWNRLALRTRPCRQFRRLPTLPIIGQPSTHVTGNKLAQRPSQSPRAVVSEEIPVAILRLHEAALVGLVDVALRMAELPLLGVGAGDVLRALHHHVRPTPGWNSLNR